MERSTKVKKEKKGFIVRALDRVERVGNALPDPATLFVILALVTVVASYFLAKAGVFVTYEGFNGETGKIEEMTVNAVNLLSRESIQHMVTTIVSNFTGFFALGTVLQSLSGLE